MREYGIQKLVALSVVAFLVTSSASASDRPAGRLRAETVHPTLGLSEKGGLLRRSLAPPGVLKQVRLECDVAGVGGGSCPTHQHCINSCTAIFDLEMVFCAAVGIPWIGQCIINASDRWAQCRRDCNADYL